MKDSKRRSGKVHFIKQLRVSGTVKNLNSGEINEVAYSDRGDTSKTLRICRGYKT